MTYVLVLRHMSLGAHPGSDELTSRERDTNRVRHDSENEMRAVEVGFKNLGFTVFFTKPKNLKSPNFRFFSLIV